MLSRFRPENKLFYGWVIIIVVLIIGITICGLRLSFGVFLKSIESEFELTRATTSAVYSLYWLLCSLPAILGGWAFDRYGPRFVISLMGLFTGLSLLLTSRTKFLWQLFLSYSVLLPVGTGATFLLLTALVVKWFDKRRGLAVGIASSGVGLGVVAMAPFATYLISDFGWRTAFMVIGVVVWLIVIYPYLCY